MATKSWYVLQTYSQFEQQVKSSLLERIHREGLEEYFGEILLPSEEVVEVRDGKKRSSQRKFFPGYLFVEMEVNELTWHMIRSIPKVSGFVGGTAEKPAPIPTHEVEAIIRRMEENKVPRPKTVFNIGEEVRIIDGPFIEFTAIIEEVNYEKNRLKVSVVIFGRSTPVDLEFHQVEKSL